MKSNTSTALAASLLAAALLMRVGIAQAQNHTLSISEVGESATPVITYDGNPVTPDPTGSFLAKDNWTIELPAGFALNSGGEVFLAEPENANQINDILVGTSPRFVVWASDKPEPAGVAITPTPDTILNAGTFTTAAGGQQTFDLVLADVPANSAPDAGSTSLLLGLGLLGLFGASRIRAVRC